MRISIRWKLLVPIVASSVVICAIAHHMIVRASIRQVEELSIRDARTISQYVARLRTYYTAYVVADARAMGMKISHEHATDPKAIPLPATLTHELNGLMEKVPDSADHTSIRLFSAYPFPFRKNGGIQGSLDQEEWDVLSRDPTKVLVRTSQDHGQPTIRYATADTMTVQGCVDCHNSHPQSPKRDWKLKDTRGVLLISVPMGTTMASAQAAANRATWMIVGVVALLLAAIMWFAQRALFSPMGELRGVARQIAAGDLTGGVQYRANDELGDVADSFRGAMTYLDRIRTAIIQLGKGELDQTLVPASDRDVVSQSVNLANIEQHRRAERLLARNADMRLVLDHVAQGLLTVRLDGRMLPECSAIVRRWFGEPAEADRLWDYLVPSDATAHDWLRVGWESLADGLLPIEVLLDQLPKRLRRGDLHLAIDYLPILAADGQLAQVLVVLSDITERVESERLEAEQAELLAVFRRMLADRAGTIDFLAEVEDIVGRVAEHQETSPAELARLLHTVKGNCAIFEVLSVSRLCHELEDRAKESPPLSDADRARLKDAWGSFSHRVGSLLGNATQVGAILVDPHDYDDFLDRLVHGVPRSDLARAIARWRLDRVQPRLERLGEQAKRMAAQLGKHVEVEIEPTAARVSAEASKALWLALVHPVRNAIDHGIETSEERLRASKPSAGKLVLRARTSGSAVTLEIEDDGRGIDWDAVRRSARRLGVRSESQDDLVQALFVDGLSTKAECTQVSGRGVGMSALLAAVQALHGRLDVVSTPGSGTVIRIALGLHDIAGPARWRTVNTTAKGPVLVM